MHHRDYFSQRNYRGLLKSHSEDCPAYIKNITVHTNSSYENFTKTSENPSETDVAICLEEYARLSELKYMLAYRILKYMLASRNSKTILN